jgi:hypothetical protein
MRIGMLTLCTALAVAASASAEAPAAMAASAAEPAGTTAATWDDSHMQSRYQETPRARRPLLSGTTGYGALASGGAEASAQVPAEIEFTSQRQWVQGSLAGPSRSQQAASESSRSQAPGTVHRGGNDAGRESQLRRGSVHGSRRR